MESQKIYNFLKPKDDSDDRNYFQTKNGYISNDQING